MQGHYERPPYDAGSMRSAYHIRALEVHRLLRLAGGRPIDVFLSHDWPQASAACALQPPAPLLGGPHLAGLLCVFMCPTAMN